MGVQPRVTPGMIGQEQQLVTMRSILYDLEVEVSKGS